MTTLEFMDKVIEDGIAAAKHDYTLPQQKMKLEGSIRGFEECRGKSPEELRELLTLAANTRTRMYMDKSDDFWFWACRHSEIEWVCNCVSAALMNEGRKVIIAPTARGFLKAAEIVGIKLK